MAAKLFTAFQVIQTETQTYQGSIIEESLDALPPGDVLIRVQYSSLNYKDALAATGHPGITKKYPHIPGIDAAGLVVSSAVPQFKPDDPVLITGFDLGVNTWGGFAQYIRVPADWIVPLPEGLTLRDSMILGTAGLTAAFCIDALMENKITPDSGEILVTGATGGVGCLAVSLLAKLGYKVIAVTGKSHGYDWLKRLGATEVIARSQMTNKSGKPLLKGRWAGVVDTVGGQILTTAIKSTQYGGCITACGLVAGTDLNLTVYPFILRGVRLIGIDSVQCSREKRRFIWKQLAKEWKPPHLAQLTVAIKLTKVSEQIEKILRGENLGRVLICL